MAQMLRSRADTLDATIMRSSIDVQDTPSSVPLYPDDEPQLDERDDLPLPEEPKRHGLHPAIYISMWIFLSSAVILSNKWIISTAGFRFPIILTTWHLGAAAIITQIMARCTRLLDSRKEVPMTIRKYATSVLPIGVFFSLTLIFGNMAYLYLSVAFIQVLKAGTPIIVLFLMWALKLTNPEWKTFAIVMVVVSGVAIASFGEMQFNLTGFLYQLGGMVTEALRLVSTQRLLSAKAGFKMDPLVSLYYFAPACAILNGITALIFEVPRVTMTDIANVGYFAWVGSALVAFLLNVSAVFLLGNTSSLVMALSGILKNIMLVGASILLFGDPVSGTQCVGFTLALVGLVVYQTRDQLSAYISSRWTSKSSSYQQVALDDLRELESAKDQSSPATKFFDRNSVEVSR